MVGEAISEKYLVMRIVANDEEGGCYRGFALFLKTVKIAEHPSGRAPDCPQNFYKYIRDATETEYLHQEFPETNTTQYDAIANRISHE